MAQYGYDKQRFPNLTGDMFDCPICTNVVRNPKQCTGCGDLFCAICIDDWKKKNNCCPKRCNGAIQPMGSMALIRIYNDLDIKCQQCSKVVKLADLLKHEGNCGRSKCWNNDICGQFEDKQYGNSCCSQKCKVLESIVKTGGNVKKMYDILIKFHPKIQDRSKSVSIHKVSPSVSIKEILPSSNTLKWNQAICGLGLAFEKGGELVMLKEPAYVFRTSIGVSGFNSGLHYWEIIPDSRTENELKVGVTTSTAFDLNTAFCDHIFGFAYYGLGQLRYNSNASGPQYGKRLKKQGTLGVFLNMDKGQLSFSLNGQNMGVAFDNPALKKGPIYPAVALLHCAGCSIRGELQVPSCFN